MFLLTNSCYAHYNLFVQRSSMLLMQQDDGYGNIVTRTGVQQMMIMDMVEDGLF